MEHDDLHCSDTERSLNKIFFNEGFQLTKFVTLFSILLLNTAIILPQEIKQDTSTVVDEYASPLDALLDPTGFLQLRNYKRGDGVVLPILELKIFEDVLKTVSGKRPGTITEQDVIAKMRVEETILIIFKKGIAAVRVCPYRTVVEGLGCDEINSFEIIKSPKDENLCVISINGKNKFIARTKGKPIEPTIWKYKK